VSVLQTIPQGLNQGLSGKMIHAITFYLQVVLLD